MEFYTLWMALAIVLVLTGIAGMLLAAAAATPIMGQASGSAMCRDFMPAMWASFSR